MDKKTLIAFLLIGLIVFLWPVYMEKVVGVKKSTESKHFNEQSSVKKTTHIPESLDQKSPPENEYLTKPEIHIKKIKQEYDIKTNPVDTLTIESNFYEGKISSAGGGTIIGWKLKKFLTQDGQWISLISDSAQGNLSVVFDPNHDISKHVFKIMLDSQWVEKKIKFRKIRFAQEFSGYGRLEKELLFSDNKYDFDLKVRFTFSAQAAVRNTYLIRWMSGLLPTEKDLKEETSYSETVALQGGELLKTKSDNTGLREVAPNGYQYGQNTF